MHRRFPLIVGSSAFLVLVLPLLASCAPASENPPAESDNQATESENPPAEGFNAAGSDARAIELADTAMAAMGGREAWDATRYVAWRFFGARDHVWDKWTGDMRFEQGEKLVLMNVTSHQGRAWNEGAELEGEDLAAALEEGYEAWVNDSYWLFMPYKLKDSGVTLRYLGGGETEAGAAADIVQMTFEDVGVTPENKYHVWVAKQSGLVEQWAYYPTADLEEPGFITPWAEWQQYGDIRLSSGRGDGRFANAISNIRVLADVPRAVFESPETEIP